MFTQSLDNPYFELESSSNGHKHRRFIELGSLAETSIEGKFDQFGLSKVCNYSLVLVSASYLPILII